MTVTADQPIPKDIADAAARWFADRDSGLMKDEKALRAWLASDPRHARAFAQMEAVWWELGDVRASCDVRASLAQPPRRQRPSRRWQLTPAKPRLWIPGAVAAGLAILAIGGMQDWPTRLRADVMTATGERRTVALPDGTLVQLNTHSAVALDFADNRRLVRLIRGEALFVVAPDARRPFTVEADGGSTTALGTRFLVREQTDDTRVTVTEHSVRVIYPRNEGKGIKVEEGQSVSYGPAHGLTAPAQVRVADALAWTQGSLVFEDRPLSEVVAELERYHPGYFRVIGADTQKRRVSGVFSIDDPVSSLRKLQQSLGLRSTRIIDRLIFLYM
ncbi:FecR family protein [Sphingobium aquiterrae]|uniref:FecR family protein n=1 Tax=Sphingobium aquiterrae TaxID=2038656 RepID=UPI00301A3CC6